MEQARKALDEPQHKSHILEHMQEICDMIALMEKSSKKIVEISSGEKLDAKVGRFCWLIGWQGQLNYSTLDLLCVFAQLFYYNIMHYIYIYIYMHYTYILFNILLHPIMSLLLYLLYLLLPAHTRLSARQRTSPKMWTSASTYYSTRSTTAVACCRATRV